MSTLVPHGIDPKIWGPPTWTSLYYILTGFDPNRQKVADLQSYFDRLNLVLPCATCAGHFGQVMDYMNRYHPLADYAAQGKLDEWFKIIREEVRKNEGLPFVETTTLTKCSPLVTAAVVITSMAVGAGIGYYLYKRFSLPHQG